jgi:hypothetical protein
LLAAAAVALHQVEWTGGNVLLYRFAAKLCVTGGVFAVHVVFLCELAVFLVLHHLGHLPDLHASMREVWALHVELFNFILYEFVCLCISVNALMIVSAPFVLLANIHYLFVCSLFIFSPLLFS